MLFLQWRMRHRMSALDIRLLVEHSSHLGMVIHTTYCLGIDEYPLFLKIILIGNKKFICVS